MGAGMGLYAPIIVGTVPSVATDPSPRFYSFTLAFKTMTDEAGQAAAAVAEQNQGEGGDTADDILLRTMMTKAGAQELPEGRHGLCIRGWIIETSSKSILNSLAVQQWEQRLRTSHLPEMVFGDSWLVLRHEASGIKIYFNAFDALTGWKLEGLPPVEVPAAAKWKFRSKPFQQVILDYDYTFTTPYCGSETIEPKVEKDDAKMVPEAGSCALRWEDCEEKIDVAALTSKEPILFYDEVVLYEDELADNGVSLLTVKVLRVDGVLMRLRDTRIYCSFGSEGSSIPVILRECCWRESTFQELSTRGFASDSTAYNDPNLIREKLSVIMRKTQKLQAAPL